MKAQVLIAFALLSVPTAYAQSCLCAQSYHADGIAFCSVAARMKITGDAVWSDPSQTWNYDVFVSGIHIGSPGELCPPITATSLAADSSFGVSAFWGNQQAYAQTQTYSGPRLAGPGSAQTRVDFGVDGWVITYRDEINGSYLDWATPGADENIDYTITAQARGVDTVSSTVTVGAGGAVIQIDTGGNIVSGWGIATHECDSSIISIWTGLSMAVDYALTIDSTVYPIVVGFVAKDGLITTSGALPAPDEPITFSDENFFSVSQQMLGYVTHYFSLTEGVHTISFTRNSLCTGADFNRDGIVDFFDYLDFVDAFALGDPSTDFNHDGVVDFFDYLDFVDAFTACS